MMKKHLLTRTDFLDFPDYQVSNDREFNFV